MSDTLEKLRIDKWLWAARFFKTRSLATAAIDSGKVHLNSARVKPAKEVTVGDELCIRIGNLEWTVMVSGLSARRGPASEAALLYEENEDSRIKREVLVAQLRAQPDPGAELKGRPTKRARRHIIRFTQDY